MQSHDPESDFLLMATICYFKFTCVNKCASIAVYMHACEVVENRFKRLDKHDSCNWTYNNISNFQKLS